jgi:uridylate kinase
MLCGSDGSPCSPQAVRRCVERIVAGCSADLRIAIVVGAGNICRGANAVQWGWDRVAADRIGMLATTINAICLKEEFRQAGKPAVVQAAVSGSGTPNGGDGTCSLDRFEKGEIVVFGGGLATPFFTTDTAAVVRALELKCDAVLKATAFDGVYSDDPRKNPNAQRRATLSLSDALHEDLRVMDPTAWALARDNDLPVVVFNLFAEDGLARTLSGDTTIATVVR